MKRVQPQNLASRLESLRPHPRIVAPGNFATPQALLALVDAAVPDYTLHMLNAQGNIPSRRGVTHETTFVGPGMRGSPTLMYYPCRLSLTPVILRHSLPVDVLLLHTSTPRNGVVSMGLEVNILPAVLEAVRDRGGLVIAQMNPNMPHTYGDALVHIDDIDYGVEIEEPLMALEPSDPDDAAQAIAGRIYSRIPDGATLQLGIGAVPDAVLASLTGRRGLKIWSEMFSDGVLPLFDLGCFDTEVPLTASFVFGTQRLYDWLDGNRFVRMRRTETTNNPGRISRTPAMVSVNSALQVDLYGQANASRIKGRIYSGFGGSTDFIVGALHSPGGHAFIALPSWHPRAQVSTIVPLIEGPVTSFQHSSVVTEYGLAQIFGNEEREQVRQLIEHCAHPAARDGLWEAAREQGRA
jgi:acyl-CoA hydrolase